MKPKIYLSIICLFLTITAAAQHRDTHSMIFSPSVKSLQLSPLSNPYMPPVIVMDTDDRLVCEFDYMDPDEHYLRYSVTHCNADWTPSQLVESEYVDGFNYADIPLYGHSQATFVHYCHYAFDFPNDDFVITKSGNYLLTVYEQDNPDQILFQSRFCMCERVVDIMATVSSNTDVDYNNEHQQVAVELGYKMGEIQDPYNQLKIFINQNTRTDNERCITHPMMVEMNKVTYDHMPELIFPAGNEYRRIETVNPKGYNLGNVRIGYFEPYYHATLPIDLPRNNTQYLYDQTQHGYFTVRNSEANESATEADYVITHFVLNTGGPLNGGKLYLEGEFTHALPPVMKQMKYDMATGSYTCDIMLKQGAYNYQYLWLPDGKSVALTAPIEGDKYQTINQYWIRVYYRPMGERYDRLVGFATAIANH
ncbi:MAG: DUF5103 domain-containing protein [Muribaculaceae bacterium]|nr:DUF5103 domain-containing protein [Muribaculaceae bacterium]